jgi:hypothetical protein
MEDISIYIYLGRKALEFIANKESCDISSCSTIPEIILKLITNRMEKIKTEETRRIHVSLLERYGIRSKTDMRKWLIKNHPDRGGDSTTFIRVLEEFKKSGL